MSEIKKIISRCRTEDKNENILIVFFQYRLGSDQHAVLPSLPFITCGVQHGSLQFLFPRNGGRETFRASGTLLSGCEALQITGIQ